MAFQNSCVVPLGITATEYRLARFPVFPQFMLATAASIVRNKKYFFILAFLPIKIPSFQGLGDLIGRSVPELSTRHAGHDLSTPFAVVLNLLLTQFATHCQTLEVTAYILVLMSRGRASNLLSRPWRPARYSRPGRCRISLSDS